MPQASSYEAGLLFFISQCLNLLHCYQVVKLLLLEGSPLQEPAAGTSPCPPLPSIVPLLLGMLRASRPLEQGAAAAAAGAEEASSPSRQGADPVLIEASLRLLVMMVQGREGRGESLEGKGK